MRRWMTFRGLLPFILLHPLVGFCLASNPSRLLGQDEGSKPPPQNQVSKAKSEYVASATCASCHEDLAKSFTKNPHQILEVSPSKGWKDLSCESCHGPGDAHVNAGDGTQIFAFKGLSIREVNKKCLSCHARAESHAGGANSLHGRNQIACTECHSVHAPKESLHLLASQSNLLCFNCHKEIQGAFAKPYRHKLYEGAISCVDCHEPHGGLQPRQMKTAFGNEPACVKCHTDKRGPFAFEHPPMRLEGCMGCHEPHGSANPKMLIRHEQRFLCLECHAGSSGIPGGTPPSFHDLRSPRFQNCSTCHLRVHGSNIDRFLLH
jgi:DmsE family decaheme c-type cytochrome